MMDKTKFVWQLARYEFIEFPNKLTGVVFMKNSFLLRTFMGQARSPQSQFLVLFRWSEGYEISTII